MKTHISSTDSFMCDIRKWNLQQNYMSDDKNLEVIVPSVLDVGSSTVGDYRP